MWISNDVVAEIERVARIHYIDFATAQAWNEKRDKSELRLMSGWAWTSRDGRHWRQSLRSQTAAYIDAWYALVAKREAPPATRRPRLAAPRLGVVAERRAA